MSFLYSVESLTCAQAGPFLYAIIAHYHSLPDRMAFVHGHETSWHHKGKLADILNNDNNWRVPDYHSINSKAFNLRPVPQLVSGISRENAIHWQKQHFFWKAFLTPAGFGDPPPLMRALCCAQFIITKDKILSNPLSLYVDLYEWLQGKRNKTYPLPEPYYSGR